MNRLSAAGFCLLSFVLCALLAPVDANAGRWEVRKELREGARSVERERREARRELQRCKTRECARREMREGYREVAREKREARREIRGEIAENRWERRRHWRDGRWHYDDRDDDDDMLKGALVGAAVVGAAAVIIGSQDGD